MKINYTNFSIITSFLLFLLQGCTNSPKIDYTSQIFGQVQVINELGEDMTQYCNTTITENGLLLQKAFVGNNSLKYMVCTTGHYTYQIDLSPLNTNVPNDNIAVYFGDITISLNENDYKILNKGHDSSEIYKGELPVKSGAINISSAKKFWSKRYMDDQFHFNTPGIGGY